jgi:hypothetical protein
MTAKTPVLPGEDQSAFDAKIEGWIEAFGPSDEIGEALIEEAAVDLWRHKRVQRIHDQRLARRIRHLPAQRARKQRREARKLGERLHKCAPGWYDARTIVDELEGTLDGCRWLLEQWGELRRALEHGDRHDWTPTEKYRALHLLGKEIPQAEYTALRDVEASGNADLCVRLSRVLNKFLPRHILDDEISAHRTLLSIIWEAESRLNALKFELLEREDADHEARFELLAFDTSKAGELMRRYEQASGRRFSRSLRDALHYRRTGELPVSSRGRSATPPDKNGDGEPAPTDPDTTSGFAAPPAAGAAPWRGAGRDSPDAAEVARAYSPCSQYHGQDARATVETSLAECNSPGITSVAAEPAPTGLDVAVPVPGEPAAPHGRSDMHTAVPEDEVSAESEPHHGDRDDYDGDSAPALAGEEMPQGRPAPGPSVTPARAAAMGDLLPLPAGLLGVALLICMIGSARIRQVEPRVGFVGALAGTGSVRAEALRGIPEHSGSRLPEQKEFRMRKPGRQEQPQSQALRGFSFLPSWIPYGTASIPTRSQSGSSLGFDETDPFSSRAQRPFPAFSRSPPRVAPDEPGSPSGPSARAVNGCSPHFNDRHSKIQDCASTEQSHR